MFTLVPDENSMEDHLCNSSFGSMVSLDYVTPDTASLVRTATALALLGFAQSFLKETWFMAATASVSEELDGWASWG